MLVNGVAEIVQMVCFILLECKYLFLVLHVRYVLVIKMYHVV